MATTFPPDGMALNDITFAGNIVVWGTDADHNTALSNLIGDSCVEFKNTTPASDPYFYYSNYIPIETASPYRLTAIMQADSVAAGNTVSAGAWWYTAAKAYISASYTHNAVLSGSGSWYKLSSVLTPPATARYAIPFARKNNTAFTAYLDYLGLAEMPVCFWAYLSSNQSIATGTHTTIQFDSENYDYGSTYDNSVNYRFTAQSDGIYSFSAQAVVEFPSNGTLASLRLYKNGAFWVMLDRRESTGNDNLHLNGNLTSALLARGDYVDARVWHNEGGNLNITGSSSSSRFMGAKVE